MIKRVETKLSRFAEEVRNLSKDDFVGRFERPFLIVQFHEEIMDAPFATVMPDDTTNQPPTPVSGTPATYAGRDMVYSLEKSGRNAFRNMMSVGRSVNNDIILLHSSISKLHAYFRLDHGTNRYFVTDPGSTNGTMVEKLTLLANTPVPIESGHVVTFGHAVRSTFLSPADLHDYIQALRAFNKL